MTTDVSYAPSGASFAVSFANAERGEPLLVDVARMVACIREQQAALAAAEDYVRNCANSPEFADGLRRTINKWRLE